MRHKRSPRCRPLIQTILLWTRAHVAGLEGGTGNSGAFRIADRWESSVRIAAGFEEKKLEWRNKISLSFQRKNSTCQLIS